MKTYVNAQDRATPDELAQHIEMAISNPAIQGVLEIVSGIMAVINEHRQIVAVNDTFRQFLGIKDPEEIFGLRPGEAISCAYANESPKGCGTGEYCNTCGAVIAVRIAQKTGAATERKVALRMLRDNRTSDICLHVRAFPIDFKGLRFIVVFMQDITENEKRYELERIFHHDIMNSIFGLMGTCRLLSRNRDNPDKLIEYSDLIEKISRKLEGEIRLQKKLCSIEPADFMTSLSMLQLDKFLGDMVSLTSYHPSAKGRSIVTVEPLHKLAIRTDESLLGRVIMNMLINACEASENNETVKLWTENHGDSVSINVWNRQTIEPKVALRIFQRHFSTKDGMGRGFGTHSIKIIGEEALGGKVGFTSGENEGTTFSITLNTK